MNDFTYWCATMTPYKARDILVESCIVERHDSELQIVKKLPGLAPLTSRLLFYPFGKDMTQKKYTSKNEKKRYDFKKPKDNPIRRMRRVFCRIGKGELAR